jgi:predicted RNA-binding protein associated with RNAse of E/G family
VLRIAPTGRPWPVWLFWEDDGAFAGHYINLELPHRRSDGETATRDLTLDLWLEPGGVLWLKDADEVEAAVACGRYSVDLAAEIHAVAEWARDELVEARGWPLDEEWTRWRPPTHWTVPALPDTDEVRRARATTLPS